MAHYYASFEEIIDCIAVFESRDKRDEWVGYQDEFSETADITPDDPILHRMTMTEKEAAKISHNHIYDPKYYEEDEVSTDMVWVDTDLHCSYEEWIELRKKN